MPNLALIGYLQIDFPAIYSEAVLDFLTYYRTNLHQNKLKATPRQTTTLIDLFRNHFISMVYMMSCEYAYLKYCMRARDRET